MVHPVATQHISARFMVHPVAMQHISAHFMVHPVAMQHISAHPCTRSSYRRHIATDVLIPPAGRPDVLLGEDGFNEVHGYLNWYFLVKIRCISDLICWGSRQVETVSYLQLTQSDDANMTKNSSSFQIFTVYSAKYSSFQDSDHQFPGFPNLNILAVPSEYSRLRIIKVCHNLALVSLCISILPVRYTLGTKLC